MIFNQTLNRKKELGSYSIGKFIFFGVCLDFALEPVYPPGSKSEALQLGVQLNFLIFY